MKLIEVHNLSKTIRGKEILKDISFEIKSGECVALIGPNGAGKTTLMDCLIGDKAVSGGQIQLNGLEPGDAKLKELVAVLPQENQVVQKLTVQELISFFQSIYPQHLSDVEVDVLLGFDTSQKDQLAEKLSGGQKRLLSFVLALIGRPQILFLDEPTAAMDTSTRQRFWEIIHGLKDEGVTILYSSHYIEEVEHTADRILVLHQGKLIRDTTPFAMRHEEAEKYFTVPLNYLQAVEGSEAVKDLDVLEDRFTFATTEANKVWELLETSGCKIDDIELTNRTLLDSLFETTKEGSL